MRDLNRAVLTLLKFSASAPMYDFLVARFLGSFGLPAFSLRILFQLSIGTSALEFQLGC